MIRSLEVRGLNNRIKVDLKFNKDLNIITGRNGSGKTTLLKLIWYLISGNLQRILTDIPFKFVSIVTDLFTLTITHTDSDKVEFVSEENTFSKKVSFTVNANPETGDFVEEDNTYKLHELNDDIAEVVKNSLFFPTFRRIEGGFSRLSRRHIDSARYYRYHRATEVLQEEMSELSNLMSVGDHKFIASISTNDIAALLTQKFVPISKKIDDLQVELSQEITEKTRGYFDNENGTGTQTSQEAHEVLEDIQEMVDKVTAERETLLNPFSVLSDLVRNILEYQAVHVTGRVAPSKDIDSITLGKGTDGITLGVTQEAISSDKLSSGEKQMLSFLCYNAFSENTPIFIDEPELSLHQDWQDILLPLLLKQESGNQFFVATHSEFIYDQFPDKEFILNLEETYA